jgi:hypothetical protein
MGFVWWSYWAMSCEHIGQSVATGPSHLVGSCRKFGDIVLATGLIVLIVHLFVGNRLC